MIREYIATRDGDVYEESLHEPRADITAVRFGTARWRPPAGVPQGQTYRFDREPGAVQRRTFLRAAKQEAVVIWAWEHGPPMAGAVLLEDCRPPGDVGRTELPWRR